MSKLGKTGRRKIPRKFNTVIANFMCQLMCHGVPRHLAKHHSEHVWEGVLDEINI